MPTITAHDENSLTLLLFTEVHRLGKLRDLLHAIRWRSHPRLPFGIKAVELHLQLGLSEFGKPDAVFVVTDVLDQIHIIIFEGKLWSYRDSCEDPLPGRQFNPSCNSMLNNQLALRYRAMRALPSLSTGLYLEEQQHVTPSPYVTDVPRSCQKPSTLALLRSVLPQLADFSLVTLTLDLEPPLLTLPTTDPSFPLLFRQDTQEPDEDFAHFGSLTWQDCSALFAGSENHFTPAYNALLREGGPNDELGDEDDRFLVGRHIVLYKGAPVLFSGSGYSLKLHQWQGDRFRPIVEVQSDGQAYNALRPEIHYLQPAPDKNMEAKNKDFWIEFFRTLTLPGGGTAPAVTNAARRRATAAVRLRSGTEGEMASLATGAVIAVDLGFAKARRSCGVAWRTPDGKAWDEALGFGECIESVCALLSPLPQAVLILEAPLSGMFNEEGNPCERGAFERRDTEERAGQRYWYSGPGAATCLAAIFFCRELRARLLATLVPERDLTIVLYEGFLSFKRGRTTHHEDARRLLDGFLDRKGLAGIEPVAPGTDTLVIAVTDLVADQGPPGAPPVLVVAPRSGPDDRGARPPAAGDDLPSSR